MVPPFKAALKAAHTKKLHCNVSSTSVSSNSYNSLVPRRSASYKIIDDVTKLLRLKDRSNVHKEGQKYADDWKVWRLVALPDIIARATEELQLTDQSVRKT